MATIFIPSNPSKKYKLIMVNIITYKNFFEIINIITYKNLDSYKNEVEMFENFVEYVA